MASDEQCRTSARFSGIADCLVLFSGPSEGYHTQRQTLD